MCMLLADTFKQVCMLSAEFQLTRDICWRIRTSGTLGSSSFLGMMVGQKLCTILEIPSPKKALAY